MFGKRGQIAIFVIIALVIVGAVVVFFVVRGGVGPEALPVEFEGIYQLYESCIEEEARAAIDLAGTQGGRIFLDEYVPGSEFSPFSNQLNFLGFPVPYWYYLAGNGVVKQNVPTKADMEGEIARYVADRVNECDFDRFYAQGFYIDLEEPEVSVTVEDTSVLVSVMSNVVASKEDRSASRREHDVEVVSKLGKFYGIARDIYEQQLSTAFLEEYGVDVMRLYAPVDDVVVGCAGEVWQVSEVVSDLQQGLEANIGSLKVRGDYYTLSEKEREYYVVPVDSDEAVSFLYNRISFTFFLLAI